MCEASLYGALCRAELRLEYLHANSTTHDFLFGAIAELIDNSRDAGATRLDIFTVNNTNLQGGFTLCFLDDGCGMTPREATDLVYFGRSFKRTVPNMIGRYGNGLKSGSMRIGKDFILFTKKENTMTCLLFSQTFCEREGLYEIVVPILSWSRSTRNPILDDPEKFEMQLSIICKHSPFKNEAELMKQFDAICGEKGTLVVIYNLKLRLCGEPELDIHTDEVDLLIAEPPDTLPEQQSLRAYTTILYSDPRMRIFIQAKKVETKYLPYCFYRPRMYPYISSSFREAARNELQKAEMEMKAAEGAVKEAKYTLKHLQGSLLHENTKSSQDTLLAAVENEKRMREKLEDKQRSLRRPKTLSLKFGINIQNRSQDGMLIYSNNRLIRMFEKVGPQKNTESYFGAGAVGMVNVPLDVMEPSHNKQAFTSVKEYNHLLKGMGHCLVQYWKDIGLSQKREDFFWKEFGYLSDKWHERPSDTIQYKRRRAVEIPDIVQCDVCLQWRLLSFDTDVTNREQHGFWICSKNPKPLQNKCNIPEQLPSIPLGTLNTSLQSLNDKKLLIDSIQQRKRKLENVQFQKLHLIQPHTVVQHTDDRRTLARNKNKNVKKTVCKRKACYKDPSPACSHLIKSGTNEGHVQNSSHHKQPPAKQKTHSWMKRHACQEDKCSLSVLEDCKDHHASPELSLETKDEESYSEELEIIKIETDSKAEDICIIISDSDTEDLPKYEEEKDFTSMHKGKQEPCYEIGDDHFNLMDCVHFEERNLPPTDLASGSTEASKEDNKEQEFVAAQDSSAAVSCSQETSQRIYENKIIETLVSHIKEVLIYFLPVCSLSKEHVMSMSPEDILTMFKLKEHSEQNKTVKLYIDQYFSQYERQLFEKIQSVKQCDLQTVHGTEREIILYEAQIKPVQERLECLRKKIAQLLLKIHPHLLINDLQDVDSYLEDSLHEEDPSPFVLENLTTTESALLDEENGNAFNTI